MPLYEYRCQECEHEFEFLVRNAQEAKDVHCPHCSSSRVAKSLSLPGQPQIKAGTASGSNACGEGPPCGAPWCQRKG